MCSTAVHVDGTGVPAGGEGAAATADAVAGLRSPPTAPAAAATAARFAAGEPGALNAAFRFAPRGVGVTAAKGDPDAASAAAATLARTVPRSST